MMEPTRRGRARARQIRCQHHRSDAYQNQHAHVEQLFETTSSTRAHRVLLLGREHFDEPVDRIVSIGSFEHFSFERYNDLSRCSPTGLCPTK